MKLMAKYGASYPDVNKQISGRKCATKVGEYSTSILCKDLDSVLVCILLNFNQCMIICVKKFMSISGEFHVELLL